MKLLKLFDLIQAAKGKDKLTLIRDNESELLKLVFRYAYSPKFVFNIKEFELDDEDMGTTQLTASNLHLTMEALLVSATPRATTEALLSHFDREDREVLSRIIKKDLRIGVSQKSFNKAIGEDYVYIHPYNRCSSLNEKTAKKIEFPCYSQVKSDGKFADLMIESVAPVHDGLEQPKARFCNRDGVTMKILSDETLARVLDVMSEGGDVTQGSVAISGELLYLGEDGKVLPRAIGNGILNSDEIDESRVLFRVWDARNVYDASNTRDTYSLRVAVLDYLCSILGDIINIEMTPTVECHNWEEIGEHYKQCRLNGEEGTIVKNQEFLFKDGTSADCIKLKAVIEGDVLVTGVTEGDGKWAGVGIGALLIETSCGMMKCSTAGLTDKQRVDYYNNPDLIIDKVIRVLFNAVVQRDGEETMALYLPRFDEVRDDKHEADSLERLLEQEASSIEVLINWGI